MKLPILLLLALLGADLRAQGNTAAEMLAKAARLGDLKSAEALVRGGVDPNLANHEGRTPLYYAALFNRDDVAALLLAHDADPNTRAGREGQKSESPQTPLQIAASMGNMRIASMLTAAGARVDVQSPAGRTALHFAAVGNRLDMIRFLIEKGASVNIRDINGVSPLDETVWYGYLEGTAVLLAEGARLNEAETKTGATPINEAAFRGETKLVHYLLELGPNLGIPDKRGYTPLENAIRMGNADAAVLLLEAGGPEQKAPEFLGRMMNVAVTKDESVVVEALLQNGASANKTLASGSTPLNSAAFDGSSKVAQILLNAGADPNRTDADGTTPLENACLKGFYSVAEMLLDHGAKVNLVSRASGETALYAAASFGKSKAVELLLGRGADPNLCGHAHRSPYEAAHENGYSDIAAKIREHGGAVSCKP